MGGKKQHSTWISPYIPSNIKTYVEPFGGAMWVYWMSNKTPVETNVYNDYNRHLCNVFSCASDDPDLFKGVLMSYYDDLHNPEKFEQYRDEVFSYRSIRFDIPDFNMAAKYMLLQMQIFTGGDNLTEKSKIYIETKYKEKYKIFTEKLGDDKYLKKLAKLTIKNDDYRKIITEYDSKDTFFYVDPPYYNMEHYYTEDDFDHADHMDLLRQLRSTNARWALSYYHFPDLEIVLPRDEFVWHEEKTHSINARVSSAERTELLIMNYPMSLTFL